MVWDLCLAYIVQEVIQYGNSSSQNGEVPARWNGIELVVGFLALIFEKGPCCEQAVPKCLMLAVIGCTQHHLDEPTVSASNSITGT